MQSATQYFEMSILGEFFHLHMGMNGVWPDNCVSNACGSCKIRIQIGSCNLDFTCKSDFWTFFSRAIFSLSRRYRLYTFITLRTASWH
jgi:hypothetical protein